MSTAIFSEKVFGAELAQRLDAVFAMRETSAGGYSSLFTVPSGISFNEADMLTLKHHLLQPDNQDLIQLRKDLNTRWLHCLAASSLDHSEETARQFRSASDY
jgi:hypothetical protein